MKKGVISLLLETHLANALREKAPALHRGKPLGGVSPFFLGTGKRPAQEDSVKKAGRLRSLTEGKAGVEIIAQPPIALFAGCLSGASQPAVRQKRTGQQTKDCGNHAACSCSRLSAFSAPPVTSSIWHWRGIVIPSLRHCETADLLTLSALAAAVTPPKCSITCSYVMVICLAY